MSAQKATIAVTPPTAPKEPTAPAGYVYVAPTPGGPSGGHFAPASTVHVEPTAQPEE
jgi:hypothetical protein